MKKLFVFILSLSCLLLFSYSTIYLGNEIHSMDVDSLRNHLASLIGEMKNINNIGNTLIKFKNFKDHEKGGDHC